MPERDYSWLPAHQHHVVDTLGHADALIARLSDILFGYLKNDPLTFVNVFDADTSFMKVASVAPLPQAVPRLAADALTQLRAALEHAIYAEVELELERPLTSEEGRCIEMPAVSKDSKFNEWLRDRRRAALPPLRDGGQLSQRIRQLQPLSDEIHPLRLLVEHTNHAKHRTPAVVATLLGTVIPEVPAPNIELASGSDKPLEPGDVLVTGPCGEVVPVSIWPKVCIRRPHTGDWHVLTRELGELEHWVRTMAIPIIVTGTVDVDVLPPQVDTTVGYQDAQTALESAGKVPAADRHLSRIQAAVLEENMKDLFERLGRPR